MKVQETIATIGAMTAITAMAGLALSGCKPKPDGAAAKQAEESPEFSDVKKETVEALKTTGEFIAVKAEDAGNAIVEAGEKAEKAVKETIGNLNDESTENTTPKLDDQ